MPAERERPLSRYSLVEIQAVLLEEAVVEAISRSSLCRYLKEDALRPWRHHSWIFPRDPFFAQKAARVLELYEGFWQGLPLGKGDFVLSADEKSSIQARRRLWPSQAGQSGQPMRVEHEYAREGALQLLAGVDVFSGHIFGHFAMRATAKAFDAFVETVMEQDPYRSARRVFWIVDNSSIHHPSTFAKRLTEKYPKNPQAIAVHLPIHASWLNQIELWFSILQRKVLTPNDCHSLEELGRRIGGFIEYYNTQAQPFSWTFTREKLQAFVRRLKATA